jgi:hypothetical protein
MMTARARRGPAVPDAVRTQRGPATSSLSGFCTRACFCRIPAATWANDLPVETVANRSVPMACGPNVDQAGLLSGPVQLGQWALESGDRGRPHSGAPLGGPIRAHLRAVMDGAPVRT